MLGTLRSSNISGRRDLSIDSLRGIAILLMVAGHVIGGESDRGMAVADDSIWRYYYVGLADIRMPLFAMLSGYVYALRPISKIDSLPRLITGKSRRLLVPLLTVGTLFFFTQLLVPGTNSKPELNDAWKVYVYSIEHLWFLQAIFLIFVIVGLLDAFDVLKSPKRWTLAVALASTIYLFVTVSPIYNVFSLTGVIRLLPFFLLGYGFNKFRSKLETKSVLTGCVIGFLALYPVLLWTIAEGFVSHIPPVRAVKISVGLFGVSILMLLRQRIKWHGLAWIGQYSFSVYLLHVFGSAGTRIVLDKIGIVGHVPVFVICMIMAIGLPILFERTLGRSKFISWAILGQRPSAGPHCRTRETTKKTVDGVS